MSNWEQKSNSSLQVANDLLDTYANQSVHCAYYSCVQYLYHLMFSEMNESEADLNDGAALLRYSKSLGKNPDGTRKHIGTHTWLHGELFRSLESRNIDDDEFDIEQIMQDIGIIMEVRIIADYKSESIAPSRAKGIHAKAENFITTLKNIYS